MDSIDLHILEKLQANARISNAEIARGLEMAPSAVLERIRKLEARGIIQGYEARVAARKIGLGLTAFVFVKSVGTEWPEKTARALADIPEVLEVHNVVGEDCFLIKLRARDTDHLAELMRDRFRRIPKIESTRTTIVLETVKETSQLTLQHASQEVES